MRKDQMYFAETRCDKLSEETVAFHVSSIEVELAPCNGGCLISEKLSRPRRLKPEALVPITEVQLDGYPCRIGVGDQYRTIFKSLDQSENYYGDVEKLKNKMLRVMEDGDIPETPKLVGVTIMDARLIFTLWEPDIYYDVTLLPDTGKGCGDFDFGLQTSRKIATGVRIVYNHLENGHFYMIEWYRKGKIYQVKQIHYRMLRQKDSVANDKQHFNGYAETLTVH